MLKKLLIFSVLTLCSCAYFPPPNADVKLGNEEVMTNTDKAMISLIKGDLDSAMISVASALKENPKDPYAMMVGGIVYDMMGVPHKARRYYEDIVEAGYKNLSLLDNFSLSSPKPLNEIALLRLRAIEVKKVPFALHGTEVINPEIKGAKPSMTSSYDSKSGEIYEENITPESVYIKASKQFDAQPVNVGKGQFSSKNKNVRTIYAGEQIFTGTDKNIVGRFITFNRLLEEGLVTDEEYLNRRNPNLGGLMPLSNPQPSLGIDRPIPDPEVIVDRLKALKTAFEIKAISAREYASERNLILDALLPPSFKDKMVPPNPPNDLLAGAEAIRRLEVLNSMGLISDTEMEKEKAAVERVVQFGLSPKPNSTSTLVKPKAKTPKKIIPGVSTPRTMNR